MGEPLPGTEESQEGPDSETGQSPAKPEGRYGRRTWCGSTPRSGVPPESLTSDTCPLSVLRSVLRGRLPTTCYSRCWAWESTRPTNHAVDLSRVVHCMLGGYRFPCTGRRETSDWDPEDRVVGPRSPSTWVTGDRGCHGPSLHPLIVILTPDVLDGFNDRDHWWVPESPSRTGTGHGVVATEVDTTPSNSWVTKVGGYTTLLEYRSRGCLPVL